MTKTELETAIKDTLAEIVRLKAIWHEAGDNATRLQIKELQILQFWHIEQYKKVCKENPFA